MTVPFMSAKLCILGRQKTRQERKDQLEESKLGYSDFRWLVESYEVLDQSCQPYFSISDSRDVKVGRLRCLARLRSLKVIMDNPYGLSLPRPLMIANIGLTG